MSKFDDALCSVSDLTVPDSCSDVDSTPPKIIVNETKFDSCVTSATASPFKPALSPQLFKRSLCIPSPSDMKPLKKRKSMPIKTSDISGSTLKISLSPSFDVSVSIVDAASKNSRKNLLFRFKSCETMEYFDRKLRIVNQRFKRRRESDDVDTDDLEDFYTVVEEPPQFTVPLVPARLVGNKIIVTSQPPVTPQITAPVKSEPEDDKSVVVDVSVITVKEEIESIKENVEPLKETEEIKSVEAAPHQQQQTPQSVKQETQKPKQRFRPKYAPGDKSCFSCKSTTTPIWREVKEDWGDNFEEVLLCNACGLQWRMCGLRCSHCKYVPRASEKRSKNCVKCDDGKWLKNGASVN